MMINSPAPVTAVPDDLITEVLSLLTVKSLLRLKCVSKSWNSLISDPFFVKIHFDKSSQNTDLRLFSAHYSGKSTYTQLRVFPAKSLLENNSTTTMVTSDDTIYKLFDKEYHQVVGSCNGLCCLMQDYSNTYYREFSLRFCNPATRSLSHKLGSFYISPNVPNSLFEFSFGYDNLTAKYKVVAFSHNQNDGLYLGNSLIWLADRARVLNGDSHYLNLEQFVIISLNLGTEKYTELLPPQSFDGEFLFLPNVCAFMDCLCFFHHSNGDNMVMWQMRDFGVEESWTKLFNFCYRQFVPNIFSYLEYFPLKPLQVLENGNTLILTNGEGRITRYNRRDNRVDSIRISDARYWFYGHRYVESLVSVC